MPSKKKLPVRGKDADPKSDNPSNPSSSSGIPALDNAQPPTETQILQAIIDDNAKNDAEKKKKDFLYEYGFRTEFGKSVKMGQQATEVETNYLEITRRPQKIHVYKIIMIREQQDQKQADGTTQRVAVNITRRNHKEGIFTFIRQNNERLRQQTSWATDFDLIWSATPLFQDDSETVAPATFTDVSAQDPLTGKLVTAERVEIKYDRTLDLKQSAAKLSRQQPSSTTTQDQANGSEESSDADVLTRGINAFLSSFAKTSNNLTSTNANTFYRRNTAHNLDKEQSLKVLQGYFISLRPGSHSLMLNVNVKHSPFFNPQKVDLFLNTCKRSHGRTVGETISYIKGKLVTIPEGKTSVHAPNGRGIITAVGGPQQQKPTSWNALGKNLGDLVINIGSKKSGQGLDGPEYFLAKELTLCDDQAFRGTLTGDQTTEMLNQACQRPKVNRGLILDNGLPDLGISGPAGRQVAAGFGLAVSHDLMKVPARLLNPPTPQYRDGAVGTKGMTAVTRAGWNLFKAKVVSTQRLPRLPVLDLRGFYEWSTIGTNKCPDLTNLHKATKNAFDALGIAGPDFKLERLTPDTKYHQYGTKISEGILETMISESVNTKHESPPHLVLLPKHDYDLYSKIKRIFDRRLGVHAVCASSKKLDGFGGPKPRGGEELMGVQYMSNIGLKFNLKRGGDNHLLAPSDLREVLSTRTSQSGAAKPGGVVLNQKPRVCETIIMGADVAHPTASAVPGCPSIAAVVGSVDDNFVRYPGSMRLQRSRQEIISDLDDMVKERLIDWATKHGDRLPTSVLFYRDGVSESQYDAIQTMEMPQLEKAFKLASAYLNPEKPAEPKFKLTFVIVGKRHNTRFYAVNEKDTFDSKYKQPNGTWEPEKNYNLTPGFVIDKKITHPYSNDFYLQSHEPLQGTGRSAHYFMLKNQMRFSADEIQKVTHSLCYIYARATKGVSYCAPAYYADRLCDRGRAYLRPWLINADDFAVDRNKDESAEEFSDRVVNSITNGPTWITPDNRKLKKYGTSRKNPWHPHLDGIMFYL